MRTFLFVLIFIFIYIPSNSQDIIIKKDSTPMNVKVKKIRMDVNLNVSLDLLHDRIDTLAAKIAVLESQIKFKDSEASYSFGIFGSTSLDETKDLLIEYFNNFVSEKGYLDRNNKYISNPYNAVFEEDFIRLSFYEFTQPSSGNPNQNSFRKLNSNLFDFSKIYDIRIDKRDKDIAYLNIWVNIKNERRTWEKYKLVLEVDGHDNAEFLNNAIKHYDQLILEKTPTFTKQ